MAAARLLPLAGDLSRARARVLSACLYIAAFGIVGQLISYTASGWDMSSTAESFGQLTIVAGTAGVLLRGFWIRDERRVWLAFGLALCLSVAGSLYTAIVFAGQDSWPMPSPGDALSLSAYFTAYVALVMLLMNRVERFHGSLRVDGALAGLCVAAFGAAFLFEPLLHDRQGDLAHVLTNLAYPAADIMMLALVVGSYALSGWRPGRAWALVGAGLIVMVIADAIFVSQTWGELAPRPPAVVSFLWTIPQSLVLIAGLQRFQRTEVRTTGWPVLLLPVGFTVAAVGLLVYGNIVGLGLGATMLAAAAVAASIMRTLLTLREVRALAETRRQAHTDDLTGLPNRRAFGAELEQESAIARATGSGLAVMVIDLDGFKELNDTLGHAAGDVVLGELGPRITEVLRGEDFLARLGGDEFAVLMPGVTDPEDARAAGNRVRDAVSRNVALGEMTVSIGASAGVALLSDDCRSGTQLLRRADVAMYQAKAERAGCLLFEHHGVQRRQDRLVMSVELSEAIARRELVIYFQPKADMRTGLPVGVEALVRWQHPERGLVPPGEFIPLAEQTGLMGQLTNAVLEQALADFAVLKTAHPHLTLAVNVAAANLLDTGFPDVVAEFLRAAGVEPSCLVLELTENSVMTDPERGRAVLATLHELGVQLALDDFGTGYSSLSYLAQLPVDELKIDRSFVIDLVGNRGNEVIVSAVTDLARNLGLRLVAEGIEDQETWERLRDHGCHEAQGFFFARPMPLVDLDPWLARATTGGLSHTGSAWPVQLPS
jgi:diguanylate cyclase (GGDEF)-like protein